MDIIDIICIFQHQEKSKITQETDICFILGAIYEQDTAKTFVCLRKRKKNKYAIHAYTHGPVTGSGPSVVEPLSVTVV